MSKHTQGQWMSEAPQYNVRTVDGTYVLRANLDLNADQRKANARLAASAPALQEALKQCESTLRILGYVNAADLAAEALRSSGYTPA